jgi:hypothetical protein
MRKINGKGIYKGNMGKVYRKEKLELVYKETKERLINGKYIYI